MTVLTHAEVLGFALAAGWPRNNANMITVIADYESGDDPNNLGDQTLSRYGSIGLTQDFTGAHDPHELGLAPAGTPWNQMLVDRLKDPLINMKAALIIFHEQGFTAWSTYNNYNHNTAWLTLLAAVEKMTPVMPGAPAPAPAPAPSPATKSKDYLDKLGNVQVGVTQAIQSALNSHSFGVGLCLQWVRERWGISAGAPDAISAWRAVPVAKRHGFYTPPAGVAVFWSGGSHGHGHVAFSLGSGLVRSTDIGGAGTVTTVPIATIAAKWGLTYLGWTETLNGVQIYKAP